MKDLETKEITNKISLLREEIKSAGNIERVLIERTALLNLEI